MNSQTGITSRCGDYTGIQRPVLFLFSFQSISHHFLYLVLSSPSERTQSTLDLVLSSFDPIPTTTYKESIYHASASSLIQLITEQDDEINNLLIIGHNPGLHILTETLTNESIVKFPTCALAKITNFNHWKDIDAGILNLESLITPKELKHD